MTFFYVGLPVLELPVFVQNKCAYADTHRGEKQPVNHDQSSSVSRKKIRRNKAPTSIPTYFSSYTAIARLTTVQFKQKSASFPRLCPVMILRLTPYYLPEYKGFLHILITEGVGDF